ncbi:fosfomycin resistance glutathione transferase [Buttiauxella sp. WJP83]|uniref:fosfomycin resistance glutathione transferase n=1 Tax=Buttiauxella sp. WJP83 TaxID=2986951 RepID=UPI0022DE271B|nr:fosfomycin resistance glutathione transferase [Buttiauxella sp. WJP83]WBM72803.1 fosfomycin resistance glutathione transferase [Buttiauxella sp. WJP83]
MLTGLNHLTLAVSDVARSFDFYVHQLGFTPRAKWAKGAYLSLGDLWLCLSLDTVDDKRDYTHYAFTISEPYIVSFREKLRAARIVEWKDNTSEGASLYFLDPDGHRLEVHSGGLETRLQACKEKPYEGMIFY